MATIHMDGAGDITLIQNKKIAVIGFGSQGHAHALNLRDSGCNVCVGLHSASKSRGKVNDAGLPMKSVAEAAAWADVIKRARLVEHHKISREQLSVREHMSVILRRLQNNRFMEFGDLFDPSRGVPVVVVNFIAMLELSREALIEIPQAEPYAPIYVRLAYSPA